MKIDADVPEWIAPTAPVLRPSEADIGQLTNFLNHASRVTLFCGAGCTDAHAEVIDLARKLKAPICTPSAARSLSNTITPTT
jgi:pyruvate dehydrogenase (quinone)